MIKPAPGMGKPIVINNILSVYNEQLKEIF